MHSTSGIDLPRIMPEGSITVCEQFFPEGTALSVPIYTVHGNKEVWDEDVEVFRLERWEAEHDKNEIQKASTGPSSGRGRCISIVRDDLRLEFCLQRTYVGRNLARLELLVIVSSILR